MESYICAGTLTNHDKVRRKVGHRIWQFVAGIVFDSGIIGEGIDRQCFGQRERFEAVIGYGISIDAINGDSGVLEKEYCAGEVSGIISSRERLMILYVLVKTGYRYHIYAVCWIGAIP